ncbi:hypothetical protein [Bradyrhizobium sp. Bra64]|uniref:hypothetical protein n=1 Tax=Bradyrhizobium sp. Bra64 TaxID=2926009 RepID=UPI002119B59E|nr:hypothetical protein [Bradyrhizobium sp. Bra64]
MKLDIGRLNLLELRKSDRERLVSGLRVAGDEDLRTLSEKIENTLSNFANVLPENEEQIYLFGLNLRKLNEALGDRSIPPFRAHPDPEVKLLFAGGFLGLSFKEALSELEQDRKKRRQEYRQKVIESKTRAIDARVNLVEDIKEAVAGLVPSQTPDNDG